jgi:hypothetical protein
MPIQTWSRAASSTSNWLLNASFLELLVAVDLDLSAQARRNGCPACGAPLHSARYPRKGHTGPVRAPEGWDLFHGLCCSKEGCRRRVRPESVRFAGRSPNVPFQVAMVRVLRSGGAQRGVAALAALARVSERTVRRWLDFWRRVHARSRWWNDVAGRFSLSGLGLEDLVSRHFPDLGEVLAKVRLSLCLRLLWFEKFTDFVGEASPAEDA